MLPQLTTAEFLDRIESRSVEYVLIGPMPDGRGPVELLIEDEALDAFEDLLTAWPVGRQVKLYTASARPGTGYRPPRVSGYRISRISLFPPHLARRMIDGAVRAAGGARVLSPADAFFARCYRAAYLHLHDWEEDGAGGFQLRPAAAEELGALGTAGGFGLPDVRSPFDLDRMLNDHGWRPPGDLLEKASYWMPWIRAALLENDEPSPPGAIAFFIRERAFEAGHKDAIIHFLKEKGFDTLLAFDLSPAQVELAERSFRGGNWGIGGWGVSGGPPRCVLITHDLLPIPLKPEEQRLNPGCDNKVVLKAKLSVRNEINMRSPESEWYSPVHSTDNSQQTWVVVRLLAPETEPMLREKIARRDRAFATQGALQDLTRDGCRARIELIAHEGAKAIRKTFRPGAERYMNREIEVMEALRPFCPEIPRLLAKGEHHIVIEYFEGAEWHPPRYPHALPLSQVRSLAGFIKRCVSHGFDPVDLKPGNNVIFNASGLKVIDFEYWRRCDPSTPPENCYCLAGLPKAYEGDRPVGLMFLFHPYATEWRRFTRLSVREFLYDPLWLQLGKRSVRLFLEHSNLLLRRAARRLIRLGGRMVTRVFSAAPA